MKFRLLRQNDKGNVYWMEDSEDSAKLGLIKEEFESEPHQQIYWIEPLEACPGIYAHFKGRYYEVVGVATDTETNENKVVYRALYGSFSLLLRDENMFLEWIYRDGYRGPRFKLVKKF